jgi:hypothetical protein
MRIISNPQSNPTRRRVAPQPSLGQSQGLSARKVNDYLRFSALLVLIGMVYIWNSYRAERYIKQQENLRAEVKSLKSRYLLKQATLGAHTRLINLRSELDSIGLYALREPAYRLVKHQPTPVSRLDTPRRDLAERRQALRQAQQRQDSLAQVLLADSCLDYAETLPIDRKSVV